MNRFRIIIPKLISFVAAAMLCSCTTFPKTLPPAGHTAFVAKEDVTTANRHTPVFIVENDREPYNRIGTVRARIDNNGREEIYIDTKSAALYVREEFFQTPKGSYRNLIYRIHFSKVPFSLLPFHIGMGKNIGLLIVVTLSEDGKPLLVTTVHTCGCYLAFLPTSYLPDEALPSGWEKEGQSVFGEHLPGLLRYPDSFRPEIKPFILIRSGSHRVKSAWMADSRTDLKGYSVIPSPIYEMDILDRLPLEGGKTTSFFETSGSRSGYVKGSHKPWERVLMSWWTFDWRIGEDKRLGGDENDGPLFYTSIKPWERKKSDMRNFKTFLEYWGWRL